MKKRISTYGVCMIQNLKKGDIFFFPMKKTPYVYEGYNRSTRLYEYHKFYDISAYYGRKKNTKVDCSRNF